MKTPLLVFICLLSVSGLAQDRVDSIKARHAVNYIHWAFTNDIVKQKRSDKEWEFSSIESVDDVPDFEQLRKSFDNLEERGNFRQYFRSVSVNDTESIKNFITGRGNVKSLVDEIAHEYDNNKDHIQLDTILVQSVKDKVKEYTKANTQKTGAKAVKPLTDTKAESDSLFENIILYKNDITLILLVVLFIWCLALSIIIKFIESRNDRLIEEIKSSSSRSNYNFIQPNDSKFNENELYEKLKNQLLLEIKTEYRLEIINHNSDNKLDDAVINNINSHKSSNYYFAAPTASGFNDNYKSNEIIDQTSLYLLEVDHTKQSGIFKLLDEPWVMRYALNERRDYIDPVCLIQGSFSQKATAVKTLKSGFATLSNGKWTVSEKALIQYV